MKLIVLGCGLVGGPMAIDLAKEEAFEITIVDKNREVLDSLAARHNNIKFLQMDLGDPQEVTALVKDYDLVINAVPGFMGFQTLKAIIEAADAEDLASKSPEVAASLEELKATLKRKEEGLV